MTCAGKSGESRVSASPCLVSPTFRAVHCQQRGRTNTSMTLANTYLIGYVSYYEDGDDPRRARRSHSARATAPPRHQSVPGKRARPGLCYQSSRDLQTYASAHPGGPHTGKEEGARADL